jgi:peptidoglycan hydrolase-like protein with peptidoglycan-binding domain
MLIAGKIGGCGILFLLLTTWVSGPRPTPLASEVHLSREAPADAHWSDTKKMQQTLQDRGHYHGNIDGVPGLRTRASIRGFQRAENLPVTGQLDAQTTDKLALRPEVRKLPVYETSQDKPSAGIKWAKGSGRASSPSGRAVKKLARPEKARKGDEKALQAENDKALQ